MVFPQVAAFARLANGGDSPKRVIAGQATKLSRAMHDIQYDELHDEIIIANPFAQAILTYRGDANGKEPPIRVLQGPHTRMSDPSVGVAVDPVHDEMSVAEKGHILVFPRTANGDVAPIRVIEGPNTQLDDGAMALGVDTVHNLLVVGGGRQGGRILIFNRTDSGDVKPRTVIAGSKTGFGNHILHMRVYGPGGWILTIIGSGGEESEEGPAGSRSAGELAIWSINDNGNVPPRWLLGGPKSQLRGTRIALNPKVKEVIVGGGTAIRTYSLPEVF